MNRSSSGTEADLGYLLQHLGDMVAGPSGLEPEAMLRLLAERLGLRGAIWLRTGDGVGGVEPIASEPSDLLSHVALNDELAEWLALEEPLARESSSGPGASLVSDARWQLVWPLALESGEQAVWLAEGEGDQAPELAAVAQLLRIGLILARGQEREREREAQIRDLKSAQELMGHIVDSLPVGLYVVDKDYRIVAWNRKRETGTQGVAREDAIGKSVFEVLYRQPREQMREELEEVFATDEIRRFEVDSRASGERRYYRLTKVPMHVSGTDEVTHVITYGEDITEQKRISERILHAEKLAALGQMAAGVMHEINNPLATITASVEAVRDCVEEDSEATELLSMVETEVDRCKRIARDLLAFSRPPPSEKGPSDIQETVEETLKLLRHHDRFKKIKVQREYVYDLPLVWANSERLIQVFVALALNALDAMEDDGILRVRTEIIDADESEVGISFIDTGCGIPQAELPKIFEPFYTSKLPGKGTGLGLSICYGIIQEHGGRIEVDSTIGLGSNFRVVLPVYRESGGGERGHEIDRGGKK
jgi:two-component system NtrC family sensor kinase